MTKVIHAELIRFARRRTVVIAIAGAVLFAIIGAASVFAAAKSVPGPSGRSVTLQGLAGHGGGTQAFATAASFVGFFVFVTFIAIRGSELSGGTFRALLLRDPNRRRVLVGQVAGMLIAAAAVIAIAELFTVFASIAMASARGVPTSAWFSAAGLGAAMQDYATVLAGVTGWAVFGTTLAVVIGSGPIALGIGFVWAGPLEHLVAGTWTAGNHWFPGLVLQSLIAGGTVDLALKPAVITAVVYGVIAAAIALAVTDRRDVTV